MTLLGSPRRRWYLLALGWAALLVLGVGGFLQQADDGGIERSTLDTLYLTLQLAALDYAGGDSALNWRLEVARFVAPMMAAGTILQTASVVFREQFSRLRARFMRDHTIVCGLGAAGSRLALALARDGERVIAVDRDGSAAGVAAARERDIPVLLGDAADLDLLRAARVDRAARVIAVCGADAVNVQIATAVQTVARDRHRPALRCSAHLTDAELCGLLAGSDVGGSGAVRIDFFNLHERAARAWLAAHPPFGPEGASPHLVVLGLGQLGRSLVVVAAQLWRDTGEGPLRMTLVDRVASGRWHALRLQHPALPEACEVTTLDLDLEAPDGDAVDRFEAVLATGAPTSVAVAFEDEAVALSAALLIHRVVRDPSVPVVVRAHEAGGLAAVVNDERFPGLSVFPFLERACTRDVVEGGVREQLAQAMHEEYLALSGRGGGYRRPWEELSDEERDSSRRRADGILEGFASIGCQLVPMRGWGPPSIRLSADEVERLAELEHERWRAERTSAGWTHGPTRDDATKRNPLLVPWAELPEDARRPNRDGIHGLPAMLARAGLEPTRRS